MAIHVGNRLMLSLSGADGDPFQVTAKDVANAEAIERALDVAGLSAIDPPTDDPRCVAPKYYPEFWNSRR